MDKIEYNEIREELDTGDLILFSGKGLFSGAIKMMTRSRFSHVGMVVRLKDFNFVALWESSPLKMKDVVMKAPKSGVRLVTLSDRIAQFKGEAALRKLEGVKFTDKEKEDLGELRKQLSDRDYEGNLMELFNSAYDGLFGENENEDLNSLFCSELVAEAYQSLGLLDDSKNSNEYVPGDFSAKSGLTLKRGRLGPELEFRTEN